MANREEDVIDYGEEELVGEDTVMREEVEEGEIMEEATAGAQGVDASPTQGQQETWLQELANFISVPDSIDIFAQPLEFADLSSLREKSEELAKCFQLSGHTDMKTPDTIISSAILFGVLMQLGLKLADSPLIISMHVVLFTEARLLQQNLTLAEYLTTFSRGYTYEKCKSLVKAVDSARLITLRDLAVLAAAEDLPEPLFSRRESLRRCIFEVEHLYFHHVCTLATDTPKWSEHNPDDLRSDLPKLPSQCSWLPVTPHVGHLIKNVAILYDHDGNYRWEIGDGSMGGALLQDFRYTLPSYFTGSHGRDIPESNFNVDGTYVYNPPSHENHPTFTMSRSGENFYQMCAISVDGSRLTPGDDHIVTLVERAKQLGLDHPTQVRPQICSQTAHVSILVGRQRQQESSQTAKMILNPASCSYFNVRSLPSLPHGDDPGFFRDRIAADKMEFFHQWPEWLFDSTEVGSDKPIFAFELVAMRGDEPMITNPYTSDESSLKPDLSSETESYVNKLLDAKIVKIAVVLPGVFRRGPYEWFKRIISAGKLNHPFQFRSLWAYYEDEDSDIGHLASRIISEAQANQPSYPKIPSHLVKSNEDGQLATVTTLATLDLPDHHTSLGQLVAIYAIGTARAKQHQQLQHAALVQSDHTCWWSHHSHPFDTTPVVKIEVQLQDPSLFRALPSDRNRLTLHLSKATSSDRGSASNNSDLRLSLVGEVQATGILSNGVNMLVLCTLDRPIELEQLQRIASRDTSMNVKLAFKCETSALDSQLEGLRRLLRPPPCTDGFDLRSQLLGKSNSTADSFGARYLGQDSFRASLLEKWYQYLASPLDCTQQPPYWACLDGLSESYGHIHGPPGTGKSQVTGRIVGAVAPTKRVLVTAQTNDCLDDLLSKLLTIMRDAPEDFQQLQEDLTICRFYSRGAENRKGNMCVFQNKPVYADAANWREAVYGRYASTTCTDVSANRLVHCIAERLPTERLQNDTSLKDYATYMDLYCRIEQRFKSSGELDAKDPDLPRFHEVRGRLVDYLLADMDIVVATIDQCPLVLASFQPDIVVLEESSQVNLPQGIKPLVFGNGPRALLTIGDKLQLGPVNPSALSKFNEMGDALNKPFITHLEPFDSSQCFALGRNYRNPPSIWEVPRRQYEKRSIFVKSAVDVTKLPLLKQLESTVMYHGKAFLRGALQDLNLWEQQQVWFGVNSCARAPRSHNQGYELGATYETVRTTSDERLNFSHRGRTGKINIGSIAATCRVVEDLLSLMQLNPVDILVQATTADDAEILERCIYRINSSISVKTINKSMGGESDIVITHIGVCGCVDQGQARPSLPSSAAINVSLTRAKVFHIIVGNIACLMEFKSTGRASAMDSGPFKASRSWAYNLLDHIHEANLAVAYPSSQEDVRKFVEPELGPSDLVIHTPTSTNADTRGRGTQARQRSRGSRQWRGGSVPQQMAGQKRNRYDDRGDQPWKRRG